MRKSKSKRLIGELVKRREEVVIRAKKVANKQIPEQLINKDFSYMVEWIITPHIKETYEPFQSADDKEVRGFQKVLMKLLKAVGRKKGDNDKKQG